MLNLYTAKTFDGTTNGVLKKLKENLNKPAKHIVIVPENFTLTGSKLLFDKLGTNGLDNLETTSFTRLAERTLEGNKKYLSKAGSLMLFTKAVLLNADKLVKYKNCKKMTGFYQEMYREISILRNSDIKAQDLINLNLPSNTKLKVEDIVTLYEGYQKLLENDYYDEASLYEKFAEIIEDNSLFTDCYFYIIDYYFFNKVQLNIIKQLAKYSLGVTIGIPINNSKNERIYPHNTIAAIENVAKELDMSLNVYQESSVIKKEYNHIVDNMFSYEKCDMLKTDKIQIYSNENIEKEVEFACIKIKQDIFKGKCRYRDYSIVISDLPSYVPIIKKIFTKYNVPFFIDKKEPMITGAGTRFLLDSIKAVINNFDKDYMLKIACNPYSNITKEDYNCFDNYIVKYGINYSRFTEPFTIAKDDIFYSSAEKVRKTIMDMLSVFSKKVTTKEYIDCCRQYLENNDFISRTNDFMDKEVEFNNEFYLPITRQMYDKIYDVLDEYEEILGNEETTFEDFVITLENMYSDIEIGLVPVYVDSVYVGDASKSMFSKVENMIVLGANQGAIPSYQKEDTILNNNDLDLMFKNDIYISPTPKSNNENAMFYVVQLLAMPEDKLIISYNEQKGASSEIIRELKYLFDINEERFDFNISDIYSKFGEDKLKEVLPSILSSYNNMKSIMIKDTANNNIPLISGPYDAIYSYLNSPDKKIVARYISNDKKVYKINNGDKLYFTKNYTYISQLEDFFRCPYKHFMDKGLVLKDREEATINNMDVGNIIHAVLENYFKQTKDFSISKQEIKNRVTEILKEIFEEPRMNAVLERTSKPLIKKLYKECVETCISLTDRLKYTKFKPYKFEVGFGYDSGNDEIKIDVDGKVIKLIGKIDRIDKYNNRIMVIDYKTGSHVSSDLGSVYDGKKIQLYMYLSALLLQHKEWKAGGVYYQPISIRYSDSDKYSRYQYLGQTNSDRDVMCDIDYTVEDAPSSSELVSGLGIKKSGELKSTSEANCLSDKEFDKVCTYVNKLSENACREIREGYIVASPYNGTCQYCEYAGVCGFDKDFGREVKKVTKKTIIEAVDE